MGKAISKWLKRLLPGAAALGVAGWLVAGWLLRQWTAQPPAFPAEPTLARLPIEAHDDKRWLGPCWAGRRDGLMVIYLKGTPLEIGYANGRLLEPQMHTLEDEFIEMVHGYVPQEWKIRLLKSYVIYRNRHLSDYIPLDYRMEILGDTLGCHDFHPEISPFYNRLLNYHAAHDISYMMIDNPFIARAGCTSFAAWGGQTVQGHLMTGRNFDWEAAEVFSRDRVVTMYEPDQGIPFISLSWAGMAGVVSGMNRAGLSVTINGAPSRLPGEIATPVAIVARDMLQHAHNLAEATDLVRRAKVFVSSLWLVGSRADGRFVVIEKTPDSTQIREPEGDSIVCANHFLTPGLRDSARNRTYEAEATSVARQARLTELLREDPGKIDATWAAGCLRDRNLPGGRFAGNGHRATLNAFIATHSTIMDLTAGIFWAASPPNQLGKFVAFDVQDFAHELPELGIPADPTLESGEYERARRAQECLKRGRQALKHRQAQQALELADKAEQLNPGFYQNAFLRGQALLALGERVPAAGAFEAALAAKPAFLQERKDLETLLRRAKGVN